MLGAPAGEALRCWIMSEKRRRQQQRRQTRKEGSGPRPVGSGRRRGEGRLRPGQGAIERELAEMLGMMAELAAAGAGEPSDALDAEQWISGLVGTWQMGPTPDPDADRLFGPGLVLALEHLGRSGALTVLRALAAIGDESYASLARQAADRLAGAGVTGPSWLEGLGQATPVAALLMCDDDGFDDGLSVIVEFATPGAEHHTLGIYIDHNMGGLVKDVFIAGSLSSVREQLERSAPDRDRLALRELDLAEARARAQDALEIFDHTLAPPVDDDVRSLRAFMYARIGTLPEGGAGPDDEPEVTPDERERLLVDFLDSPEGQRWRGNDDARDVVELAIDFGADYNHGGPLRWSPVVVEIFMTDWLARKVTREPEFFERVPDVLRGWVKFAGQRRGVPAAALREAVSAVKTFRGEMLDLVNDPETWGPAKTFAIAAQQAGVDLSDPDAVGAFVERHNEGLTT